MHRRRAYPAGVTVVEPHDGAALRDRGRAPLDDLVSDAAEVTRHLAEVPPRPRRTLTIPDRAVGVVAGLDSYGD